MTNLLKRVLQVKNGSTYKLIHILIFVALFVPTESYSQEKSYFLATDYLVIKNTIEFISWDDAISYVRKNYSSVTANTGMSSWIRSAEYFDANKKGYLILNMNGKNYLFKGVPIQIWRGLQNAPSKGSYYHQFIKGRFHTELNDIS